MNNQLHRDAFADVWAALRQPCTAWVARQLASHLQRYDGVTVNGDMRAETGRHRLAVLHPRRLKGGR